MELLPNDMIYLIFDNIKIIKDKRNFLRTCSKYYSMAKIFMNNIKYAIFSTGCDYEGCYTFDLRGIFDDLNICRMYIKNSLLKHPIRDPSNNKMNKENDYTLLTSRNDNKYGYRYASDGFIIEEIVINEFI